MWPPGALGVIPAWGVCGRVPQSQRIRAAVDATDLQDERTIVIKLVALLRQRLAATRVVVIVRAVSDLDNVVGIAVAHSCCER